MNANAHSLLLPAGLPGTLEAGVQEAIPRVEPGGQELEAGWALWRTDLTRLAAALGIQAERREDVLQDVYLTARANCPAGIGGDTLRRWLFRVTANQCRLEHRRRQRWGKVFAALLDRPTRFQVPQIADIADLLFLRRRGTQQLQRLADNRWCSQINE